MIGKRKTCTLKRYGSLNVVTGDRTFMESPNVELIVTDSQSTETSGAYRVTLKKEAWSENPNLDVKFQDRVVVDGVEFEVSGVPQFYEYPVSGGGGWHFVLSREVAP